MGREVVSWPYCANRITSPHVPERSNGEPLKIPFAQLAEYSHDQEHVRKFVSFGRGLNPLVQR